MGRKVVSGAEGKTGRVKVNTTELCVTDWNAEEMADEEDVTNSCSGQYTEREYGHYSVEGNVSADWDAAVNPVANAPTLRAGTTVTDLRLFVNTDGTLVGTRCHFPEASITKVGITVPSKGKVSYNFSFKNKGAYAFLSEADYGA